MENIELIWKFIISLNWSAFYYFITDAFKTIAAVLTGYVAFWKLRNIDKKFKEELTEQLDKTKDDFHDSIEKKSKETVDTIKDQFKELLASQNNASFFSKLDPQTREDMEQNWAEALLVAKNKFEYQLHEPGSNEYKQNQQLLWRHFRDEIPHLVRQASSTLGYNQMLLAFNHLLESTKELDCEKFIFMKIIENDYHELLDLYE